MPAPGASYPEQAGGLVSPFTRATGVISYSQMEYFRQPLYDRVNLGTSVSGDVNFFSVANGGTATLIRYQTAASVTKTYRDSNLPSSNQDPNRDYAIYGIAIGIIPINHTPATNAVNVRVDKDVIKEGGAILVKVSGNKELLRVPILGIPELNAEAAASTTATNSTVFGGPMRSQAFYPMTTRDGRPWLLPRGTIIQVTMTFDGTLTLQQNNDIIVWFDADVRRPL